MVSCLSLSLVPFHDLCRLPIIVALVASLSHEQVAVGIGFSQLLRGLGREMIISLVNIFIPSF